MACTSAIIALAVAAIAGMELLSQAKESFAGGAGGRSGITEECNEKVCEVRMTGLTFAPDTLKVRPGATVVWTNSDKVPHTVTSRSTTGNVPLFDSGVSSPIAAGEKWDRTFATPGTFRYYCAIHPRMTGEVVVTGEPIEEFPRLTLMILAGAGVFGAFGLAAALYRRKK